MPGSPIDGDANVRAFQMTPKTNRLTYLTLTLVAVAITTSSMTEA